MMLYVVLSLVSYLFSSYEIALIVHLYVQVCFSSFKLVCYRMEFRIGLYVVLDSSLCRMFFCLYIFLIFVKGEKGYDIIVIFTCIRCLMHGELDSSIFHMCIIICCVFFSSSESISFRITNYKFQHLLK